MPWWLRLGLYGRLLLDEKKEGDGGGGGGGDKKDAPPDLAKELEAERSARRALEERLSKLEGRSTRKSDDDDETDDDEEDLSAKARKHRKADDKKSADSKALEQAIKFDLQSESWLKTNQALLPKTIGDIFVAASKEKFEDAIEKDRALKAGIINEFFAVQANVDLLTAGQKAELEDYQKLTKNGKQERAQRMFDMVFEPAFETLKRVTKADALRRGHGSASDSDEAYKRKLIEGSQKHYGVVSR